MNRILAVTRLHTVTWVANIAWPWGIMLISLAVNLIVFAAIGDVQPNGNVTGGLSSLYVVSAIVAGASISQVFPFALGMGVTRRTFYLATALVTVVSAFAYAIVLLGFKGLEGATDGFGVNLFFFRVPYVDVDNPFLQIAIYAVPFLFFNFLTMFAGILYVRWGMNGLFTAGAATILLAGLAVAFVTWRSYWGDVWNWISDQSAGALIAGYPAAIAAVAAVVGLATIRRANA